MKHSKITKKDIIPPAPKTIEMKRIHAIVLGLAEATHEEQCVIACAVDMIASGMSVNAFKHLSPDDRMALSKLTEVRTFNIN